MGIARFFGILLILAGTLGLIYGGFTYTKDTHTANLGAVSVKVAERESVLVPVAASATAIAVGVLLLLGFRSR